MPVSLDKPAQPLKPAAGPSLPLTDVYAAINARIAARRAGASPSKPSSRTKAAARDYAERNATHPEASAARSKRMHASASERDTFDNTMRNNGDYS